MTKVHNLPLQNDAELNTTNSNMLQVTSSCNLVRGARRYTSKSVSTVTGVALDNWASGLFREINSVGVLADHSIPSSAEVRNT
jgi:hypothetical protein